MIGLRRFAGICTVAAMTGWALLAPTTISAAEASPSGAGQLLAGAAAEAKEILASASVFVKGGLIVHFGCTDGRLTAALRPGDAYVVHGLAFDASSAGKARQYVQSLRLYGSVAVDVWSGRRLPYTDNLVNLFVAQDLRGLSMDEVLRVLTPGGVACIRREGRWTVTPKPRPPAIDEWTHSLYDASNNAVSRDTIVGPPQRFQWLAEPRNTRHHNTLASVSVVVSAGGRLFYIIDEAPAASVLLPPQWQLAARDAFNGVPLWKRPIASWKPHLHPFRSGPTDLSRRLVATGDRVYVTLGLDAPLAALNAATGQTVTTYAGTEGTDEVLYRDGTLYLVIGRASASAARAVAAVDAASGDLRWKRSGVRPVTLSLAADRQRVFWLDRDAVVAVNAQTGEELWRTKREVVGRRPNWSAPTLVVHGDVVLCADRRAKASEIDEATGKRVPVWAADNFPGDVVAYAAQTGKPLWTARCAESFHAPIDVFVNDNLVWLGQTRARTGPDFTEGRDLLTGEVRRRIPPAPYDTQGAHHRCYRDRATVRYLLTGRTGVEFIDMRTGEATSDYWVRGVCQYGIIPANGLLYAPPHSCACYIDAKLTGLAALAPGGTSQSGERQADAAPRLEPGPAPLEKTLIPDPQSLTPSSTDWPTYRHDPARSGRASTTVAPELLSKGIAWQSRLGGRLTSPVIAEGRVLAASIDAHTVYALDAGDGRPLWQYTVGGRIDSPPTISQGLVVFGSADGWVYCVRASDGTLVWRFLAAPEDRRLMASGQVESVWPTSGSVLVQEGSVYCAAGRSSYLDGGIYLHRLDLKTGRPLAEHCVHGHDPGIPGEPDKPIAYEVPGTLPDVLSCDGQCVYMRQLAYDPHDLRPRQAPAHLYSPAGFLNDDWWHRTYWIFGTHFYSGYIGWYFAGHEAPAGRLLVIGDAAIYGFGYKPEFYRGSNEQQNHLFAIDRRVVPSQPPADYRRANRDYPQLAARKWGVPMRWSKDLPLLCRTLVLSGDTLFAAGPPRAALKSKPAYDGADGAILCAVAAADGHTLAEYQLDAIPVFDGMAAAQGRLYMTLQDGRLVCFGNNPRR
jgi:outer membrane protein assembly factor BamB